MARKTGKGYSKHGNKYRVKVRRSDGTRGYETFATEAEALAYAQAGKMPGYTVSMPGADRRRLAGMVRRSDVTVLEYGRNVLFANPDLRPNTRNMYEVVLRRIESTALGALPVSRVGPADVRAFRAGLTANADNVRRILGIIFAAARDEGLIKGSLLNGWKVSKPKARTKDRRIRALTPDQVEALARATKSERDALAIRLGAYVGLRAGELGGLTVHDVDVEGCRIHVRRNAQRDRQGGVVIGEPKTETSARTLKVDCRLIEDVVRYVEAHPPLGDGTVFYSTARQPMTDQPLTHMVTEAAKRAGLWRKENGRQWPTFHSLRNTCASLLIATHPRDPKVVQTYLGHSTLGMTYDLYGDLFEKHDEPLAEAMGALRAAAERKALPAGEAETA